MELVLVKVIFPGIRLGTGVLKEKINKTETN